MIFAVIELFSFYFPQKKTLRPRNSKFGGHFFGAHLSQTIGVSLRNCQLEYKPPDLSRRFGGNRPLLTTAHSGFYENALYKFTFTYLLLLKTTSAGVTLQQTNLAMV